MTDPVDNVRDSYTRCVGKDPIGRFYEKFLASDPRIPGKFAHTDFKRQKELLNHSIHLAIMYASGDPVGRNGLLRIRESHGRTKLDISRDLYSSWKDCFVQAIAELDPKFSDECRDDWDHVLQKAIDFVAGNGQAHAEESI